MFSDPPIRVFGFSARRMSDLFLEDSLCTQICSTNLQTKWNGKSPSHRRMSMVSKLRTHYQNDIESNPITFISCRFRSNDEGRSEEEQQGLQVASWKWYSIHERDEGATTWFPPLFSHHFRWRQTRSIPPIGYTNWANALLSNARRDQK